MKKTILLPLLLSLTLISACTTSQQGTAINTLSALEIATTASYDSYITLVVNGTIPTNDVPSVSKDFNTFQQGVKASIALLGTSNAIAPATIVLQSSSITNKINQIEGK